MDKITIQVEKVGDNYRADILELPGSPDIGISADIIQAIRNVLKINADKIDFAAPTKEKDMGVNWEDKETLRHKDYPESRAEYVGFDSKHKEYIVVWNEEGGIRWSGNYNEKGHGQIYNGKVNIEKWIVLYDSNQTPDAYDDEITAEINETVIKLTYDPNTNEARAEVV
jgi:hypothetical protein